MYYTDTCHVKQTLPLAVDVHTGNITREQNLPDTDALDTQQIVL